MDTPVALGREPDLIQVRQQLRHLQRLDKLAENPG